jgi:hypothetical protein
VFPDTFVCSKSFKCQIELVTSDHFVYSMETGKRHHSPIITSTLGLRVMKTTKNKTETSLLLSYSKYIFIFYEQIDHLLVATYMSNQDYLVHSTRTQRHHHCTTLSIFCHRYKDKETDYKERHFYSVRRQLYISRGISNGNRAGKIDKKKKGGGRRGY